MSLATARTPRTRFAAFSCQLAQIGAGVSSQRYCCVFGCDAYGRGVDLGVPLELAHYGVFHADVGVRKPYGSHGCSSLSSHANRTCDVALASTQGQAPYPCGEAQLGANARRLRIHSMPLALVGEISRTVIEFLPTWPCRCEAAHYVR